MDMRDLVGRNVRRIRLAKGLTQESLAERSGFSQQYLSDLELGRRNPTVVTLFELAQALGAVHLDLLIEDVYLTAATFHGGLAEDVAELVEADRLDEHQRAQARRLIAASSFENLDVQPADPRRQAFAQLEIDRVVGWIVASRSHARAWRVEGLASERGRPDLPAALVAGLERQARDAGMLVVHAEATEPAFYLGLGYQVTGRLEDAAGPDQPAIQLAKSLAAGT
jgi:transcriptional regulator with XRE-family HTH domain